MQPAAPAEKVLLIGWDAADWKVAGPLVDAGLMPHLRSLIQRGASGPLQSDYPLISPLLWTSAVTGKCASQHHIFGPLEARPDRSGTQPVERFALKAKPIWRILDDAGFSSHTINFPASHPAEQLHGVSISNYFALTEVPEVAARSVNPQSHLPTLNQLRVRAKEIDTASLLTFVPRATEIDQQSDDRLLQIARILAHTATVHAATTWSLENIPWRFAAVCYTGLHQFSHGFMAYHPPQAASTSDRDFSLYAGVISAAYQFHDLMLGRLIELAGENATVVLISDHGFHSDHLRPAIALNSLESMLVWHRPQGILAMAGAGIVRGKRINGAALFDIAPTILSLFGLPAAADFDGRVLGEVLVSPHIPERRISWEESDRSVEQSPGASASDDSIAHLLALGYVEKPDHFAGMAIGHIERSNLVTKALVFLESGDAEGAIAILEPLVRDHPQVLSLRIALARAYAKANRIGAARRLVEDLAADRQETALMHTALGILDLASRRPASAITHLERAGELGVASPDLQIAIGQAYLRLARWNEARDCFQRVIAVDPDRCEVIEEMAAASLGCEDLSGAIDYANKAIAMRPDRARSHYLLGLAMLRSKHLDQAITELEAAVAINPRYVAGHHWLAEAYLRAGNGARAKACQLQAQHALIEQRLARRRLKPLE